MLQIGQAELLSFSPGAACAWFCASWSAALPLQARDAQFRSIPQALLLHRGKGVLNVLVGPFKDSFLAPGLKGVIDGHLSGKV